MDEEFRECCERVFYRVCSRLSRERFEERVEEKKEKFEKFEN